MKNYEDKTIICDTVSAWVSVSEVLSLVAENNANGIRIYYGRHNDDDPKYPNRHNVILVATRDKSNPENPTTEESEDLLNEDEDNGIVNSVSLTFAGVGDDTIPLCKPNCGKSSLGAKPGENV
jgi:hypothetical protein